MRTLLNFNNNIMASLVITLICLLYTILLSVMYFCKGKEKEVRNKLYKIMLITVLFTLISELIKTICMGFGIENIFSKIIFISHWWGFIVWLGIYYIYCLVYLEDIDGKSIINLVKSNKKIQVMLIFILIILSCYTILPFSVANATNIIADHLVLSGLLIIGLGIIYETLLKHKDAPLRRKVSILLVMLIITIVEVCQLFLHDVNIYIIGCSLQIFFLYFTIENPEIRLAKEMEELKKDIDRSNKTKTDFLSNMSHEIRTPMNAIIGFSDSLLNNPTYDENVARNDIQSIATASNNLLDIINNILDISKIESGKEVLEEKEYKLNKMISELGSIIEARLGNSPIKFIVDLNENLPSVVYGDATKLYQVLLNIANNSVKYTEVGKIKLTAVPEFKDRDTVLVHFKIADTGYGIKKEDFDKLFSKFERLDSAISNEIEGTGLGLVITKKFVDLMGGKIWFTSEFEVGTTFYVDVPLKVIDSTPIGKKENEKVETVAKEFMDCSNYTALVVDDNKLNIKVAERILKKYNFKIESTDNGKDCVYKFKSGNHYDIVFLDHMMPEMDGIETLHIIKKLDDFDIPPIIALTANAMTGMKEMYLREGFDYYLAKPININELDKIIHKCFDKENSEREFIDEKKDYVEYYEKTSEEETVEDHEESEQHEEPKEKATEQHEESKEEATEQHEEPKEETSEDHETSKEETVEDHETSKEEASEEHEESKEETPEQHEEPKEETVEQQNDEKKEEDIMENSNETMEEYLRNNKVDLDKALELLGDMEMYNMTIKDFMEEVYGKWERINQYKESSDMENYAIEVHSLKSDCKYLGFMDLADISYQHELKSKEKDINFVNENFETLNTKFNEALDIIKKYIEKYNI